MTARQVLVIEDDKDIALGLRIILERGGLAATLAGNGRDGLRVFHSARPDLVILDVGLPEMDGWTVLERIRDLSDVPVLMLTAHGQESDKVRGLHGGADDYLTKPFGTHELLARIRALLRRVQSVTLTPQARQRSLLLFAGWKLDVGTRRLTSADGAQVPLTGGEFELLAAFCDRPKRVLTRDQLLDLTRGRNPGVFDRSIDIQVSRLRRKIEADPKDPMLIQTVRSGGYIFTAEVTAA